MASLSKRPDRPKPFTVRWREGGTQRRRSFTRERDAKDWRTKAEAIEAQERRGAGHHVEAETFAQAAEEWLASRSHLGAGTLHRDRSILRNWLLPAFGDRHPSRVTKGDLARVLAAITDAGRSVGMRSKARLIACGVLDYAVGPQRHALREVKAGTDKRRRKPQPFLPDEVQALVAAMPTPWDLFTLTVARLGLRPQEGRALQAEQFDWERATVTVDRAVKSRTLDVGPTKTQEVRTLALPATLAALLRDHVEAEGLRGADLLFPAREGKPVQDGVWRRHYWAPAVKALGLDDRVPYDLRHTCASRLIAAGASVVDVAEWMGHGADVTMRVYGHLFPGRKAELAAILDDAGDAQAVA